MALLRRDELLRRGGVVEEWWGGVEEGRDRLSRDEGNHSSFSQGW